MEKDDDVKGSGNSLDFGNRIYDSRLGRFLSMDKMSSSFPWQSSYLFAGNTPIQAIDVDGDRLFIISKNPIFIAQVFFDLQLNTNTTLILLTSGEVINQEVYNLRAAINKLVTTPATAPTYNLDIVAIGTPSQSKKLDNGTNRINKIINHPRTTRIHEKTQAMRINGNKPGNATFATDKLAATAKGEVYIDDVGIQLKGYGTGIGSDVDVFLDYTDLELKYLQTVILNKDGTKGIKRHLIVMHEITHGLHMMEGKLHSNGANKDPEGGENDFIDNEESNTRKEMNLIEKEQHEPQRATP